MLAKSLIVTRYESPAGELLLGAAGDRLCLCDWVGAKGHAANLRRACLRIGAVAVMAGEGRSGVPPVIREAARQLDDYFAGRRRCFGIPLIFSGSEFQDRVWSELLRIPFSQTVSYSELAWRIGYPTAVRAVAGAVGANPISILVPCHRVIGSSGALTGYAGGLPAKQLLLNLESTYPQPYLF